MPADPERSKRDRHDEILRAAFEEFAAHGYESTRLDDVARRLWQEVTFTAAFAFILLGVSILRFHKSLD